jgi:cyclase
VGKLFRRGGADLIYSSVVTRTTIARLSAAALFFLLAWIAYTQNPAQPPQLTINKVKDDLYEIEGDGGNVAVLVTKEGVVLVDDKYDQDHDAIVTKVKSVTDQPIKYILTTHHHGDHSGGNAKFVSSAQIISTANARKNIVEHKQGNAPAGMEPARLTFTDQASVFLGGREVRAYYFGRGHTNGDALIYFPELRTLHTGDLMAGTSPLIDYPGGGSIVEWTKTLDAAMKLDFETVIPGHGAVTNKAGLLTYRNNVEKLRTRVSGLIHEGKSQDEVGNVLTAEYKWQPNSLNMQWSLPGMMTELK